MLIKPVKYILTNLSLAKRVCNLFKSQRLSRSKISIFIVARVETIVFKIANSVICKKQQFFHTTSKNRKLFDIEVNCYNLL